MALSSGDALTIPATRRGLLGRQDLQELPDKSSWLLRKAVEASYNEQYRKAKWFAFAARLLHRNDYFTLCWYANCLYFASPSGYQKAASLYSKAIKTEPSNPLAHAGLGRIHYANAIRIMEDYSTFPGGSQVMFADERDPNQQGLLASIVGFADTRCANRNIAISELEQAAELTDNDEDKVSLLCMSAEMRASKSNRMGIDAFKHVLDIDPDYVLAHFHLAECYSAANRHKDSLKEYEFVRQHAPDLASELAQIMQEHGVKVA